ncbi:unnamed protein product [Vicia faba]|uniref:NADH-plastoquinone oxidoreductase subunit 1 n=1 Tax=Vicia faba TaxID=3906 RepID=A0AAV0YX90_VICFA|nr:unnamed protein product [Vicia faba]
MDEGLSRKTKMNSSWVDARAVNGDGLLLTYFFHKFGFCKTPIGIYNIVERNRFEITAYISGPIIGPEYAGPFGILQALADGTKLLFKENLIPSRGDIRLFSIGPSISIISILISYSVIPFGYNFVLSDFKIGVFLWIAISSIAPIGLLMSGYGSNNKYSFLGGLRAAAQSISYEIPLTLCVLSISLRLSNSLSTVDIVDAQAKYGFWGWNLWRQPMGFIVFLISSLAECERLLFDLPEAEEELVAGYQTEYSVLYLGGSNISILYIFVSEFFEINKTYGVFGTTIDLFITLAKSYFFLFVSIITRWSLPRLRMDQLLNLGWKFLLPISLGNLLLTTSSQLFSL